MATYFHSPNSQREATPMIYTRESWQGSNPEPSTVIPASSMMMYMNYLSSNNTNELPQPQQELLSSLHGPPRIGDENEFSVWGNGRSEMPFMPPMGSATSLLQGVQSLQGHGQGLSLSLSTQIPPNIHIPTLDFRNPNPGGFSSFSGPNNSLSSTPRDDESSPNKHMRSGEYPLQPGFVGENSSDYGITSVGRTVPNSKYLKAAQQLLDEVVNVRTALKKQDSKKELAKSGEGVEGESRSENKFLLANEASSNLQDVSGSSANELSAAEKQDFQNKLNKLLTMLDEVDRRYKQYYHQMQIVVSSFDVIAGCGAAKPYTALALQTISRHFRCLRDALTNQIRAVRKSLGEQDSSESGKGVGISRLRYVDQHLKQQRALQQLGMMQQHAWRPQRGLPERSVSILRAWLFEHFLHPYPKDSEKLMLARQTGLTRSQVSNWFINARVRLWKPMVEEMYKEEACDAEMDAISSPETGNKATKGDMKASGEMDNQELQQSTNSTEQCKKGQFLESKDGLVSNMEMIGTSNPTLQSETDRRGELRPCLDDSGLFQGYQIPGFGRFGNPNGVSLTLGLQHCEGGSLPISVDNQNFAIYNTESSSMGPQTADFEMDSENRQHRYGSSHLLRKIDLRELQNFP